MSRSVIRPRIVVAEDDEGILELVTIRLELAGYHTVPARNGLQALERIFASKPAALVLDIGMPQLDGFEVLSAMDWQGNHVLVPTLMLTARHAAQDVRRALELGAWDFLAKPFDDRLLVERVGRLLQRAGKPADVCFI